MRIVRLLKGSVCAELGAYVHELGIGGQKWALQVVDAVVEDRRDQKECNVEQERRRG